MCSIANLFDTNIRQFDAKKAFFFYFLFYPDFVTHYEKLSFVKNKIKVLDVELWLKIKRIES